MGGVKKMVKNKKIIAKKEGKTIFISNNIIGI